ncbi:MAG TPA: family 16 glycosylhydrolase [Rubellimicrobium sp.]|nr:family 16 glycosylhydrolase [Rubellimicrobium sp.]
MSFNLYTIDQAAPATDAWLVSTWTMGNSPLNDWSAQSVSKASDGSVTLTLAPAPAGSAEPYMGGEIQQTNLAQSSGSWSYVAKAPTMVDGGVFGMFLYQADYRNDWLEYDFEFVGSDTSKVQITVHQEDPNGGHISSTKIVSLGFDAAQMFATYTINVDADSAEFYVNGNQVAQFSAKDMADGQWDYAPLHSYVDLWATDNVNWAGAWKGDSTLRAQIKDASYTSSTAPPPVTSTPTPVVVTQPAPQPAPQPSPEPSRNLVGDSSDNTLTGGASADTLDGRTGRDTLSGLGGTDTLMGGKGNDLLNGGAAKDILTGGADNDTFRFDSAPHGPDLINDFSNKAGNNDIFHFSASGFGGGLVGGGHALAASQFQVRADNFAQDSDDRFILRTTDKTLWFDVDGKGGVDAVMVADLQSNATVTADDIWLM